MPKICYQPHTFNKKTAYLINHINQIITDYQQQGFDLTLRQLYYQLVSHDLFPDDRRWTKVGEKKWIRDKNGTKNAPPNYDYLGRIVSDARLAGLIDWDVIVDRTRNMQANSHWETPADILLSAEHSFQIDKWEGQDNYVEVWVEKDALIGVVERACRPLDVPFFACRGYNSQSEMWRAARRFAYYASKDRQGVIVHLGDHDPSGLDMTRDILERISELFGIEGMEVHRIALNFDQIEQYNPPPNPAKETDSRWQEYVDTYNTESSWELDALDPNIIVDLITQEVESLRDEYQWQEMVEKEQEMKEALRQMRLNYKNGQD